MNEGECLNANLTRSRRILGFNSPCLSIKSLSGLGFASRLQMSGRSPAFVCKSFGVFSSVSVTVTLNVSLNHSHKELSAFSFSGTSLRKMKYVCCDGRGNIRVRDSTVFEY